MNRPNPGGWRRIEMLATVLVIDYFRSFNTNHYSRRDSKKLCRDRKLRARLSLPAPWSGTAGGVTSINTGQTSIFQAPLRFNAMTR